VGDEAASWALNCVTTGGSSAGDYDIITQSIEGVRSLAGKTVTISFWAFATTAPKVALEITQNFGSGGSPSASVLSIGTQAFTMTTGFVRYSATVNIPSISGKTLGTNLDDSTSINFWLSSGSTYNASRASGIGVQTSNITFFGFQLELGGQLTSLEDLSYALELEKCQRYYQIGTFFTAGYTLAFQVSGFQMPLPVTMRATPTVTTSGVGVTLCTGSLTAQGNNGLLVQTTQLASNGVYDYSGSYTLSAEL
jgi:hypothetical protein